MDKKSPMIVLPDFMNNMDLYERHGKLQKWFKVLKVLVVIEILFLIAVIVMCVHG